MKSIYDNDTLAAALAQPIAPGLAQIIRDRWSDAEAIGLRDLTHILVVEPGDNETDIEEEIGFRPSVNPIDGVAYPSPAFCEYWSWLDDVGPAFELIHNVGNDGFAFIVLLQKAEGVPRPILRMCREFTGNRARKDHPCG